MVASSKYFPVSQDWGSNLHLGYDWRVYWLALKRMWSDADTLYPHEAASDHQSCSLSPSCSAGGQAQTSPLSPPAACLWARLGPFQTRLSRNRESSHTANIQPESFCPSAKTSITPHCSWPRTCLPGEKKQINGLQRTLNTEYNSLYEWSLQIFWPIAPICTTWKYLIKKKQTKKPKKPDTLLPFFWLSYTQNDFFRLESVKRPIYNNNYSKVTYTRKNIFLIIFKGFIIWVI